MPRTPRMCVPLCVTMCVIMCHYVCHNVSVCVTVRLMRIRHVSTSSVSDSSALEDRLQEK